MERYLIPKYLGEPLTFALLTLDELLCLLGPMLLGMLRFNAPALGFLLGSACAFALRRLKGGKSIHGLSRKLYWHFPLSYQFKVLPNSSIRHYRG